MTAAAWKVVRFCRMPSSTRRAVEGTASRESFTAGSGETTERAGRADEVRARYVDRLPALLLWASGHPRRHNWVSGVYGGRFLKASRGLGSYRTISGIELRGDGNSAMAVDTPGGVPTSSTVRNLGAGGRRLMRQASEKEIRSRP